MKKLLSIIVAAALLSACEDLKFNGQINVHNSFSITEEYDQVDCNNRFDWWNCQSKNLSISSGAHTAEITLTQLGTTKQIILKLDGKKGNDIKIEMSKDINVDSQFYINSSDIKQNFDISGQITTEVTNSSDESAVETCSETHYERRCHWEQQAQYLVPGQPGTTPGPGSGHGPGGGHGSNGGPQVPPAQPPPPPREVCEDVPVTLYGDQDVQFHYQTIVKNLTAQFVKSQQSLADFQGQKTTTDKIYTYKGMCRLNRPGRY